MISARWKRNISPPSLPSELVALALRDLTWAEKDSRYTINMHTWVDSCGVCFAGAVMARRFKIPVQCSPDEFDSAWTAAFYALEEFRQGDITGGLAYLGIKRAFKRMDFCFYGYDPILFKRNMMRMIVFLRGKGL